MKMGVKMGVALSPAPIAGFSDGRGREWGGGRGIGAPPPAWSLGRTSASDRWAHGEDSTGGVGISQSQFRNHAGIIGSAPSHPTNDFAIGFPGKRFEIGGPENSSGIRPGNGGFGSRPGSGFGINGPGNVSSHLPKIPDALPPRCHVYNCEQTASYSLDGEPPAMYCNVHSSVGMISVSPADSVCSVQG